MNASATLLSLCLFIVPDMYVLEPFGSSREELISTSKRGVPCGEMGGTPAIEFFHHKAAVYDDTVIFHSRSF